MINGYTLFIPLLEPFEEIMGTKNGSIWARTFGDYKRLKKIMIFGYTISYHYKTTLT
jgi:hypothetical protein